MGKPVPIFTRATFQFFRDLARNNKKVWMDANRERYQEFVVRPFRRLLEEVSPAVLQLDSRARISRASTATSASQKTRRRIARTCI
jgi:uncharacterized protein (DUF2461 family)